MKKLTTFITLLLFATFSAFSMQSTRVNQVGTRYIKIETGNKSLHAKHIVRTPKKIELQRVTPAVKAAQEREIERFQIREGGRTVGSGVVTKITP